MNPILNLLQGNQKKNKSESNFMYDAILLLKQGENPDKIVQILGDKYPEFKDFAIRNKGKSVEELSQENNIDISKLMK